MQILITSGSTARTRVLNFNQAQLALAFTALAVWQRQAGAAPESPAPPPVTAPTPPPTPKPADAPPPDESVLDPLNLPAFADRLGRRVTVEGKVLRIGESKSGDVLYVNFSDQYRQAVSLVLFVDPSQKNEIKAGLEGRVSTRVRASGPLEDYKGSLQVRLRGAEDIQVAPKPST